MNGSVILGLKIQIYFMISNKKKKPPKWILSFLQNTNKIEFITIASEGNATDFGDRTVSLEQVAGASSPTRGIFAGGNPYSDVIDFVEILTTGNATDFGDLTAARTDHDACSNAVRAVWVMGNGNVPTMDYITIASTGNAADFGDVQRARRNASATSNSHAGLRSSS